MPDPAKLQNHQHLRLFGRWLNNASLWHLNRRSAAGAFAVGLFMAWMPLPCQMLLAAGGAILLRVNLPVSVALVWLTNPLTIPPLFYFAYQCGSRLLGRPPVEFNLPQSFESLLGMMGSVGLPFLFGSVVLAIISSLLGYLLIRGLWRLSIQRRWARRRQPAGSILF